ncbi:flagellar hook protein FlgK [Chania multitudinisentens RB-25]|uniref:Flagellar hook-associated protein 1 n=1 Tax=Chania multitudinisentens RB-25 TaxID=1441930 RepID=W0L785_9GAMM|nr:flagellar hook-associated protein FlgK [Chania multitudinisentens]AHG19678.1 flagellar hook protein FlgK [Chania multitudinisentens RB-25]
MNMMNIAWSGLQAAQIGMNVTSMNVANKDTAGYSRQGILQSAIGPMGQARLNAGNGVQVDSIRRISDQYLVNQLWQTTTKAQYHTMFDQYISALEKVVGTDSTSLGNGLDEFVGALSALSKQPDSQALRQQLINQAGALATRFNNVNSFINSQKASIDTQRNATVDQINTLSAGIADYNSKIADMEANGGNTSALRDARDELVRNMNQLVSVKVTEDNDGKYTVSLESGQPLVSGKIAGTMKTGRDANGNPTLNLKFTNSEFSLNPAAGSQMSALYHYETTTLKQMQDSVQGMAEAIATLFNNQLAQGYDLNGNIGKPLFIFDPTDPTSILKVADITPDELALSSAADEPGNGGNLEKLIELKNQKITIPGLGNMSLSEGAASIISSIGITSRQNKIEMEAAVKVLEEAQNQRDNLSAVNQDEEAMNLQIYMQSYQANLKVIATGNQIFSDLLSVF